MLTTLGLAAYLYLLEEKHDPTTIILAGDSAGGGMVLSMLVTLRDQGIPLPAGAILISPWVDLTHSFPSLGGDDKMDYIPSHGFIHKPSMSWRKLILQLAVVSLTQYSTAQRR
jgi:acetyl esterase/lipase